MYQRVHYFTSMLILFFVLYFVNIVFTEIFEDESDQVDEWLEQNDLGEYKKLFRDFGEY